MAKKDQRCRERVTGKSTPISNEYVEMNLSAKKVYRINVAKYNSTVSLIKYDCVKFD